MEESSSMWTSHPILYPFSLRNLPTDDTPILTSRCHDIMKAIHPPPPDPDPDPDLAKLVFSFAQGVTLVPDYHRSGLSSPRLGR